MDPYHYWQGSLLDPCKHFTRGQLSWQQLSMQHMSSWYLFRYPQIWNYWFPLAHDNVIFVCSLSSITFSVFVIFDCPPPLMQNDQMKCLMWCTTGSNNFDFLEFDQSYDISFLEYDQSHYIYFLEFRGPNLAWLNGWVQR